MTLSSRTLARRLGLLGSAPRSRILVGGGLLVAALVASGCGGSTVLDDFQDPVPDATDEVGAESGGSETSVTDSGSTTEDAPVATDGSTGTDATVSDATTDAPIATDSATATDAPPAMDSTAATDALVPPDVQPDLGGDVRACSTFNQAKEFGGHCYIPLQQRSWIEARNFCRDTIGGHLVTITSAEEQTFVNTIQPGADRWIGLARPQGSTAVAANYTWITTEPVSYSAWTANEPNGSGNCVRMIPTAGTWSDQSCANTEISICERE